MPFTHVYEEFKGRGKQKWNWRIRRKRGGKELARQSEPVLRKVDMRRTFNELRKAIKNDTLEMKRVVGRTVQ